METERKKPTWIWCPGDFELYLGQTVHSGRYQRNMSIMPIWRVDPPHPNVMFQKHFILTKPQKVFVTGDGLVEVEIENRGNFYYDFDAGISLSAGEHTLFITVFNSQTFPSLYVESEELVSDDSWDAYCFDYVFRKASCWNFIDRSCPPSAFHLETKTMEPISAENVGEGMLYDFGKESFGAIRFLDVTGSTDIIVTYGESREEALDTENAEIFQRIHLTEENPLIGHSFALRYVYISSKQKPNFSGIVLENEYLPLTNQGGFCCSDPELEEIYKVSLHTLHLNSREFLLDGIKRDRWVWSGDATQSYLLQFYSFNDYDICKRTMRLLRGNDPVKIHLNTIQDYTCYWFISLYDYYLYSGDKAFMEEIYDKAVSLMDFCFVSVDENGFFHSRLYDWVFVDWADMSKEGLLSFMQIIFARSLEAMAKIADLVGDKERAASYQACFEKTLANCFKFFWSEEKGCFTHGPASEKQTCITKYANMFALFFGYLDDIKKAQAINNAILHPDVQKITTPYMRFYELMALCEAGQIETVTRFLKEYWGGMLKEGATSFWEEYIPELHGVEKYEMYERKYGKSLCHAWSAGPILLFGKYYLGVKPVDPGYKRFVAAPSLGGLTQIEGKVPTPDGWIEVYMDEKMTRVANRCTGMGTIKAFGKETTVAPGQTVTLTASGDKSIL